MGDYFPCTMKGLRYSIYKTVSFHLPYNFIAFLKSMINSNIKFEATILTLEKTANE